jgi:glucosyl-3-phosphoglycerate synthase
VSAWLERNTHHWDDWTLADLTAAKADRAVSLVVPARNEAATVGDVVDTAVPFEGGRVTELVARPLIRLLFPALAGLHQPLAGEWAVRRSLFEQLSVPHGYAVELASLVDTERSRGIDAIAQVDLGTRAHRHQALRDLSGMSTQILAAALARIGAGPEVDERAPAVTLR